MTQGRFIVGSYPQTETNAQLDYRIVWWKNEETITHFFKKYVFITRKGRNWLYVWEKDRNEGIGHRIAILTPYLLNPFFIARLFHTHQARAQNDLEQKSFWAPLDRSPVCGYLCIYDIHNAYLFLPVLQRDLLLLFSCLHSWNILFTESTITGYQRLICRKNKKMFSPVFGYLRCRAINLTLQSRYTPGKRFPLTRWSTFNYPSSTNARMFKVNIFLCIRLFRSHVVINKYLCQR